MTIVFRKPAQPTQSLRARQHLKEVLVAQLAKQLGAQSDPRAKAVIGAEADRALAAGAKLTPANIRQLARTIRAALEQGRPRTPVAPPAPPVAALDWQVVYEFKKVQTEAQEAQRLQGVRRQREELRAHIQEQMAAKEAARRADEAREAAYAAEQKAEQARHLAAERDKAAERRRLLEGEAAQNRQQAALVEARRQEAARLRALEDERAIAEIRRGEEAERARRAAGAVAKAAQLEAARVADAHGLRLKAQRKAKEDAEQLRLNQVWKEILEEQERKRADGLRAALAKQQQRQGAYAESAGAALAGKARRDEANMLRWQQLHEQREAETERRKQEKLAAARKEMNRSIEQQRAIAQRRREEERAADQAQAAALLERVRAAEEEERRARDAARTKAHSHAQVLRAQSAAHRKSKVEGVLSEGFMAERDKQYNAKLIQALAEYRATGKVADMHVPLG